MADQWRGDCLGIAGHPVVETPNLDRIFHNGVIFDQAYFGGAVLYCCKSGTFDRVVAAQAWAGWL